MKAAAAWTLLVLAGCGGESGAIDNPTTPVISQQQGGAGPIEPTQDSPADLPPPRHQPAPGIVEEPEPPPAAPPHAGGEAPAGTLPEPADEVPAAPVAEDVAERRPGVADTVRAGDSLSTILNRAGVGTAAIRKIVAALEGTLDPTAIRVGQHYNIELEQDGTLKAFTFRRTSTSAVVVKPKGDDYVATEEEVPTTVREQAFKATVQSSLWAALTASGAKPALVDVVVETFAYDLDFFTATHKGDTVRIIVERHEVDGAFVRYGRVLAATYEGRAGSSTVLWWPKGKRYVNAEGRGVTRTLLKTPLKYARISSGFNRARMHPVLHKVKSHRGVDYAAPEGTPVWAAAAGKVAFVGPKGGAGNLVVIQHGGGLKTQYMHLSKFAKGIKAGKKVAAKTVIGYVGSTGLATGAHLHFGVLRGGKYVDPQKVDSARGPGVPKSSRGAFKKHRDRMLARLNKL